MHSSSRHGVADGSRDVTASPLGGAPFWPGLLRIAVDRLWRVQQEKPPVRRAIGGPCRAGFSLRRAACPDGLRGRGNAGPLGGCRTLGHASTLRRAPMTCPRPVAPSRGRRGDAAIGDAGKSSAPRRHRPRGCKKRNPSLVQGRAGGGMPAPRPECRPEAGRRPHPPCAPAPGPGALDARGPALSYCRRGRPRAGCPPLSAGTDHGGLPPRRRPNGKAHAQSKPRPNDGGSHRRRHSRYAASRHSPERVGVLA